MFTLIVTEKGGAQNQMVFDKTEVTIGRVAGNDIVLPKGNVSKRHSRIVLKDGRYVVVDLKSTNGTYVNGRKIVAPVVIKQGDKVYIGDFIISLDDGQEADLTVDEEEVVSVRPSAGPMSQPPMSAPPMSAPPMMDEPRIKPPPLRPSNPTSAASGGPPAAPPRMSRPDALSAPPAIPGPPLRVPSAPPQAIDDDEEHFGLDDEPIEEISQAAPRPVLGQPLSAPPPAAAQMGSVPPPSMRASAPPSYVPSPHSATAASAPVAAMAMPAPAPLQQTFQSPSVPPPAHQPPTVQPPAPAPVAVAAPPAPPAASFAEPPLERPTTSGALATGAALRAIMGRVAQTFDIYATDPHAAHDQGRWQQANQAVTGAVRSLAAEGAIDPGLNRDSLGGLAVQEAVGLGAFDALTSDATVQEIVALGPSRLLVDSGRGLEPSLYLFSSHDAISTIARRILAPHSFDLDENTPTRTVLLGEQWAATIMGRPLVVNGPIIVLRRLGRRGTTLAELVETGVVAQDMAERIRAAVSQQKNIVVSGPLQSGVTTMLGAIALLSDSRERVIAVEKNATLGLAFSGIVGLNFGGNVSLRDALSRANLLRPERLIIDDVDGAETSDALSSMAARKHGTFLGVHADSPEDALRYLELLAALDGRVNAQSARGLVQQAVSVIVQLGIDANGRRRVVGVQDVR